MVSRKLMAVWGVLDFLLLATGGASIAFAILFKAPNPVRNLVLSDFDLNRACPIVVLMLPPAHPYMVTMQSALSWAYST